MLYVIRDTKANRLKPTEVMINGPQMEPSCQYSQSIYTLYSNIFAKTIYNKTVEFTTESTV